MIRTSTRSWRSFAATTVSRQACRPRGPQHKDKVERAVSYVRGNALKGGALSRWRKRTSFCANGRRRWLTNAFTARPANRWPHALKRNAPPAAAAILALSLLSGGPAPPTVDSQIRMVASILPITSVRPMCSSNVGHPATRLSAWPGAVDRQHRCPLNLRRASQFVAP